MFTFKGRFEGLTAKNTLFLASNDSDIVFYYGLDELDRYCIALKYSIPFPKILSTKLLHVERKEDVVPDTYWLYISLLDSEAKNVFISFADDLFSALNEYGKNPRILKFIEERIKCWKRMFGRVYSPLSEKALQGVFGELYFLYKYLIPEFGIAKAINSWSGPLGSSKDFMTETNWYEVKTVSRNSTTITISSMDQLNDAKDGMLVVNRVDEAPEEYSNDSSDVMSLYESIINLLNADTLIPIRENFYDKLAKLKFAPDDEYRNKKFKIVDTKFYLVNKDFPRLTEKDIKYVSVAKISYDLILRLLEDYEVKEWK